MFSDPKILVQQAVINEPDSKAQLNAESGSILNLIRTELVKSFKVCSCEWREARNSLCDPVLAGGPQHLQAWLQ